MRALGQIADASEFDARRSPRSLPDYADAHLNLGIALTEAKRPKDAFVSFQRVVQLNRQDWDAFAELASLSLEGEQLSEALKYASNIPAGKGRMPLRLRKDPRWTKYASHQDVQKLRQKHGVTSQK